MPYSTKHFDHDKYYASKSTNELKLLLSTCEEFCEKYPMVADTFHKEHRHKLRLLIAQRIGTSK